MRADYNFAIGILCYYSIKRATDSAKLVSACIMVSVLQTARNLLLGVSALLYHKCHGCGMVPSHEECVGYETLDEPQRLETVRSHSDVHAITQLRKRRPQVHSLRIPCADLHVCPQTDSQDEVNVIFANFSVNLCPHESTDVLSAKHNILVV